MTKQTEFNLSDKIEGQMKTIGKSIPLEDVKEFIRLLKEILSQEFRWTYLQKERADYKIDKLAGENLK